MGGGFPIAAHERRSLPNLARGERMHVDLGIAIAGLLGGIMVGLTGMGGGAFVTPMLVLVFGVPPLAAVSSDLVASAVTKPIGAAVHLRRGGVDWPLVRWLALGSVPAALVGALLLRLVGQRAHIQSVVSHALGVALVLAAGAICAKALIELRRRTRGNVRAASAPPAVRPLPTLLVGVAGGLVVGLSSVGSGSLVMIALLLLYPTIPTRRLVGTDLLQAVPLVAAAAGGHLLFGDVRISVTVSLLLGSVPGVYLGARAASAAPGGLIRRALVLGLLATGLALFDVDTVRLGALVVALTVVGSLIWAALRVAHGEPWRQLRHPRQDHVEISVVPTTQSPT